MLLICLMTNCQYLLSQHDQYTDNKKWCCNLCNMMRGWIGTKCDVFASSLYTIKHHYTHEYISFSVKSLAFKYFCMNTFHKTWTGSDVTRHSQIFTCPLDIAQSCTSLVYVSRNKPIKTIDSLVPGSDLVLSLSVRWRE